jgi:hypothetical protein
MIQGRVLEANTLLHDPPSSNERSITITMLSANLSPRVETAEAAAILGVKPQTLEVWRCTKRYPDLPYYRVGRRIQYARTDLERWLESRKVGSTPDSGQ